MATRVIILGGTGYVSGELLRLIAAHPQLKLAGAVSGSQNGARIASVFPHLQVAFPEQTFCSTDDWLPAFDTGEDVAIFSAAPHGASAALVREALALADSKNLNSHVVDLSADFRYSQADQFAAVYGSEHAAPELLEEFFCCIPEHTAHIPARHAGHPGCFATAMLLSAMPLYSSDIVSAEVFVSAVTGSTGSGRTPASGTHHPVRHSNMYAYKPLGHRHVPEVENLIKATSTRTARVSFVPHSGPFARGIYATLQAKLQQDAKRDDVLELFERSYAHSEFVQILDDTPKLKDVVSSNYAHIGVQVVDDNVVVMCAIDNLVKGAAGGGMQLMNRLCGMPETAGLQAPAPAWT